MISACPPELVSFAVLIEAGLALVMLVMALVVWLSRGASHAMALAAIGFLAPQPFLAWAFWRAAKGLGEEGAPPVVAFGVSALLLYSFLHAGHPQACQRGILPRGVPSCCE